MNFLKHNKFFFTLLFLFLVLFISLQFISCNSGDNLEEIISSINSEEQKAKSLREELLLYEGLSEDAKLATEDLITLSTVEKNQHRFWNNILNPSENIFTNWKNKSPESINADLTRLYSRLRNLCKKNNINFNQNESTGGNLFGVANQAEERKYGFGLSSYDGFWPSFSKNEAKLLGIQSKIISTLIEYLTESSNGEHRIKLLTVSREPVGQEDSQHIAGDQLTSPNFADKLVRYNGGIKSFAFVIKFKGHTSHARSFINQLRPPFLVKDLIVNRSAESTASFTTQSTPNPFSGQSSDSGTPLPIVQNVESTFTFLIEYIYEIERDFESFLVGSLKSIQLIEEPLQKFLEFSGNSKMNARLDKIFLDREIR